MSTDQTPDPTSSRLILCWRRIRDGYVYANILSHHIIGAVFKTVVAVYFIFCLLLLVTRYAVLPYIDHYKADIEQLVTHEIGQPVSIATLHASWEGIRPRLLLGNVVIRDKAGRPALTLPKVSATLSWWSVTLGTIRLQNLEIDHPDLNIRRDAAGNLYVAGILVPTQENNNGKGADWVLSQHEIAIRSGTVRWIDDMRGAPELPLKDVNLVLRNHWQHHEFALRATPPQALATPIDLRAAFDHPRFSTRIADPTQWKGALYVDLRNTDLAAWNAYIDLPSVEVHQGQGSIRAWLEFNRAKVADFTADLTLANTMVRLQKDLPLLSLDQVNGRVSVREEIDPNKEDGTPTLGLNGHTIVLTNFSMRTSDGLVLPPSNISESYEPAKAGQPSNSSVAATVLDLQTLADVAQRLPLSAEARQSLADFAPHGQVRNFSVRWQGDFLTPSSYDLKGQFIGLSLKARAAHPARPKIGKLAAQAAVPIIPGGENLTGQVAMNDRGGSISLASDKMQLELPGVFADPLVPFDKLTMQASWVFQGKDKLLLQVNNLDFVQNGLVGSLSGTDQMSLNQMHGKSPGIVDFTGHIAEFDVKKIGRYLPLQTGEQFRNWITGALVGGSARDVAIKVKGDLKDFPFHTETASEKPKGEFSVTGKIVDGVLNYAPGNTLKDSNLPFWPLLEDIQGTIAVDRTRLEINAERAKTHGVVMSTVKAVIDDLVPPKNILLKIDGNAEGPLQEFVGYTKDSLVRELIGGFTDDTKANGSARLALHLELPLSHLQDVKLLGKLQFANNDINLLAGMPTLSASTGMLEFSEKGLNLNNIHANFLGGPTVVSGGGPNGAATIKAEGMLTADGLRKFATASTQQLAQRVSGSAHYNVAIMVKPKRTNILVESNLQGLALDLPAPLRKEANESWPTKFEMSGLPASDAGTSREEIKLALGSALAARYEREKPAERNTGWHVVRGGIGVNAPVAEPASGLLLSLSLKSLNADTWLDMIGTLSVPDPAKENGAPPDGLNFSEYVSPDTLAIRATEFVVFGRKLDNVVLGATLQKDVWKANIDSAQASGYITYAAKASQGKGRATARLSSLIIPEAVATEVTELLEGKNTSKDIPALDIEADNFDLSGKHLGKLELIANNVHTAVTNEWRIESLLVSNADAVLNANGEWKTTDGNSLSHLNYTLDITDAGRLLGRLGFADVLSHGKGRMNGDISWNGAPYLLDSASLSGQLHLDIASGQFLQTADPVTAKLLGVLSLQSLPRRLTFDFRDVFSKGFAFDDVAMDANISKGVVSTDNLKMRGVDATVQMNGSADTGKETENLHIVIIPELDARAASLAYVAINPVIGLGSFVAQWVLRAPLMNALTEEMQVTGPWKDPKITKLERKKEEELHAAPTQVTHIESVQ